LIILWYTAHLLALEGEEKEVGPGGVKDELPNGKTPKRKGKVLRVLPSGSWVPRNQG